MSRRQTAQQNSTGQIIEPGRIPDPPTTWYPLGSVPLASTGCTEGPRSSQDGDTVKDTPVRGPSCPNGPWGRDGGKLDIIMNNLGQPIMEAHSTLATRLGVLARDGTLAPLNYYDWRCVPDHYKTRIWDEIKANTNADESMRNFLMKSVAKKWREWKHEAKSKGFNRYTTDMQRLANRPARVHENQWRCLVYHWGSREAQDLSEKNYHIRKKQTFVHTTGRTPHCVIHQKEKKKRNNTSPTRIEMFIATHMKDGNPINDAAGEIMAKLSELKASHEGSTSSSKAIDDEIFAQVMGPERSGRLRGYGMGPTPSQLVTGKQPVSADYGEDINSLKQIVAEQNERMKIMEQALSAMGITLPMSHSQHTDVGSTHNEVPARSHHESHSVQEIEPSLQPQTQPCPDHEADGVIRSHTHHSSHEHTYVGCTHNEVPVHSPHHSHSEQEIEPLLQPQTQPCPDREADEITRSCPHHSSHEAYVKRKIKGVQAGTRTKVRRKPS